MKILPIVLILAAFAACSGQSPETSSAVALLASDAGAADPCSVPAAIPDDGLDDRAAIQAALTSQGCAHLEPGTYDVFTPFVASPARRAYGMITLPAGAQLSGAGDATTLSFSGDAHGQDWYGIWVTTSGVRIHDLHIASPTLVGTSEQTHAIRVSGPVTGFELDHVSFNHPARGLPGGDCIQFVGYAPAQLITGARVHDNAFTHCDRSGVAFHSGMMDMQIVSNTFPDTGDQDIDGEGSGDNDGLLISRNYFGRGPLAQSASAIGLGLNKNVTITQNLFDGREVSLYSCDTCEIGFNTVRLTLPGDGVISVIKASPSVNVHHNWLERTASAGPGAIVRLQPHGSGTPSAITIADNRITQSATGPIVDAMGVVGLYVLRNDVTYSGAANGAHGVLANGSTAIRATDIRVDGNHFAGPLLDIVAVSGSYAGCGTVTASDNVVSGAGKGLVCGNFSTGSGVLGPVTVARNVWPAPICGPAGFVTAAP